MHKSLITYPYSNKHILANFIHSPLCADYVELTPPQAVILLAGPASQTCFTGDIIDDDLALEPVEQFTLRLRDPVIPNVLIGNDETVVRIIDDDGECDCMAYVPLNFDNAATFSSNLIMCICVWGIQ